MRSVADFYQDCQAVAHAVPPLDVKLADAVSCVLAEDVQAPFNLPVADLSACDGYAVRVRDCEGATLETPVTLPVTEEIRAGAVDPAALIKTVFEGHADSPVGLLGPAVPWAAELRAWKKETYPGASGAAATGKVPGATAAGTVPAGTAITLASYTDRPELGEMVPLLAQQLEAAGFKVTQDVREYNQIESEALAGKFHAVLVSRSTVLDSGDAVAYMTADFSSSGSYSMSGLHDEKVDAAISKAAATQPGDERRKAIMAAEQAILVTGAAIPLAHERLIQGEAAGVSGAQRDPGERALITSATTVKK